MLLYCLRFLTFYVCLKYSRYSLWFPSALPTKQTSSTRLRAYVWIRRYCTPPRVGMYADNSFLFLLLLLLFFFFGMSKMLINMCVRILNTGKIFLMIWNPCMLPRFNRHVSTKSSFRDPHAKSAKRTWCLHPTQSALTMAKLQLYQTSFLSVLVNQIN